MPARTRFIRITRPTICFLFLLILAASLVVEPGCTLTEITIAADPSTAELDVGETLSITAVITGTNNSSDREVIWSVCDGRGENCVSGGNSTVGTVAPFMSGPSSSNPTVVYTAPSSLPSPPACLSTSDGCAVVVRGQLARFDAACFTTITLHEPSNPVPAITTLSPSSATVGSGVFSEGDLTVTGTGFVTSSVVRWDGSARTTTFISDTHLSANIPNSDIAVAGTFPVTVFNPTPGGGTSNAVVFTVNNPVPALISLVPSSATEGAAAFTLTASGSGFVSTSVVQWNGSARTTTFVSGTQLQAAITAADIAIAGTASVTVFNPAPGGGTSNALTFTITSAASACTVGVSKLVSVASDGTQGNLASDQPAISADGRFVAFTSPASTLVPGDTNATDDVFLRDTCGGTTGCTPSTIRVSVATDGTQANSNSDPPALSADGRFVAFSSFAGNLVAGDTNGRLDVFVRDTCIGVTGCTPSTTRVSVLSDGSQADFDSFLPALSAGGRFVAFPSNAFNLVPGDTNNSTDVFVRDTCFGATGCTPSTIRVSVASDGTEGNGASAPAAISGDGRFVAFISSSNNLVPGDTNAVFDVFVRDTCAGAIGCTPSTARVSVASDGSPANSFPFAERLAISVGGRFVAFRTDASNLVPGDTNATFDVFVHDRDVDADGIFDEPGAIATVRVSVGSPGDFEAFLPSGNPTISSSGRFIAFESGYPLAGTDTNGGLTDVFVRDTCFGATGCTPSTILVSVAADGTVGGASSSRATISADGRFVALGSLASNLVTGDANGVADVFLAQTCTPADVGAFTIGGFTDARSFFGSVSNESFSFMTGPGFALARSLLQNVTNFGPSGTIPEFITFAPPVGQVTVSALRTSRIFAISPLQSELSAREACLLGKFVEQGGALLEVRNVFGGRPAVLGTTAGAFVADSSADITVAGASSPLIVGPFGTVVTITTGANSNYATIGQALAVTTNSDTGGSGPNILMLSPGTGFTGLGRAVFVGDEEIFMTGTFTLERVGQLGGSNNNDVLLRNIIAFLLQSPGLSPTADFSACPP